MAPRPSATRRSHGSRARSTRRAFLEDGSVLHHHAAAAQGMTCQGIPAAAGYTPHRGSDAPERAIDRNGGPMAETAAAGTAPPMLPARRLCFVLGALLLGMFLA